MRVRDAMSRETGDAAAFRRAPAPVAESGASAQVIRNGDEARRGPVLVQRQAACACGGGCPRCRAEGSTRAAHPIQTKLDISAPGDAHEQEADRVADEITRLPNAADGAALPVAPHDNGPSVQRDVAAGGDSLGAAARGDGGAAQKLPASEAAHAAADLPDGVREAVGSPGEPLDAPTRATMERRFGHDFGAVRVHTGGTASRSARELEATAYTVGREVVFAEGKYQPATTEGRRLIAHELTHVVQQSGARAATPVKVQRQREPWSEEKKKERMEACMAQKDEILPGRVGVLVHIDRDVQLEELFGADYPALKKQILADRGAREFVCEAGVPAIVALAETRGGGPLGAASPLDVAAARASFTKHKDRYGRVELSRRPLQWRLSGVQERLEAVNMWAVARERATGVPSKLAVEGPLPAAETGRVEQAIAQLETSLPMLAVGATRVGDALKHFGEITKHFEEAREAGRSDYKPGKLAAIKLRDAADAAGAAAAALERAYARADVGKLLKPVGDLKSAITDFAGATEAADSLDTSTLGDLRKAAKKIADEVRAEKDRLDKLPEAAQRVLFVLRYFKALNAPDFAGAPSADDQEKFKDKLGGIGTDLETVLGGQMGLDLFPELGAKFGEQLKVRSEMKAALGRDTALVPSRTDVEARFTALARATNAEVISAYEEYAKAFFVHRGVSSAEDLRGGSVQALYERPLSISGTRPLVCTGYALLGARLFRLAGARFQTFILGVRASADQIANNEPLSDAHALARLERNGATLFVSNDLVVSSQAQGFSPTDIGWENPNNPLFTGTGATIDAAVNDMIQSTRRPNPRGRRRP